MSCHSVNGCSPATAARSSSALELSREIAAQLLQLSQAVGDGRVRIGAQLERRAVRLGARVRGQLAGQPRHHGVGLRGQRPAVRVEQHDLLLDADRPRRRLGGGRPARPGAGPWHGVGAPPARRRRQARRPRRSRHPRHPARGRFAGPGAASASACQTAWAPKSSCSPPSGPMPASRCVAGRTVRAGQPCRRALSPRRGVRTATAARRRRRASRRATARRARSARPAPRSPRSAPSRRPRDGAQVEADAVDRLVVEGVDLDRAAAGRLREARVGRDAHLVARLRAGLGSGGARSLPSVNSGRCWCSVPWRATLSSCAPRQMPRIGMRRR